MGSSQALLYTQLPPTTPGPQPNTTSTTTTSGGGGTTTTTTSIVPTTPPAGFMALNITCPPDITVTFASMLDPDETGRPTVFPGNYLDCASPVTVFQDMPLLVTSKKKKRRIPGLKGTTGKQHQGVELSINGIHQAMTMGEVLSQKGRNIQLQRTPFFPQNNLETVGPFYNTPFTGEPYPDSTSAASNDRVVSVVKTTLGSLYTVTSLDHGTILGQFQANATLAMPGGPCSTSQGDGHVAFDYHAQRWILLERAELPFGGNWYMCLYLSFNSNPLGMYTSFEISFGSVEPQFPRLGVWRDTYALTINATTQNTCVIDREELLNGTFVGFCATPLSGTLAGFVTQSWAPMSLDGDSPMPPETTGNGFGQGRGVVFMRHRDDELHNGQNTPDFDVLDVEHWSSVNFTDQTYFTLRYGVDVQDFDSSFAGCPNGADACIPTPGVDLDPVRQYLTHQLLYRNRGPGLERVVGSYVSHANGVDVARVKWFELSFEQPTPTSASQFILKHEGTLPFDDGLHRWLPAIAQDANGTDVIIYNFANATTMPGLAATYKTPSDPLGQTREEHISFNADPSQPPPTSSGWGQYASIHTWPDGPQRWFFVSSSYLVGGNWNNVLYRIRVQGELIKRTFTAEDGCNVTSCMQLINID